MKRTNLLFLGHMPQIRFGVSRIAFASIVLVFTTVLFGMSCPASAVVVIQDGFDDADRDNDGFTDDGNNTPVGVNDGISWYAINGLTADQSTQKPQLTTIDDSGAGGIGTGNALNISPIGAGSEWMGVFGQTITLGPNLGDKLVVSYDVRLLDALLPPFPVSYRFGIYADSDNQFGTASVNSDGVSPTIWGETDGQFDNCTFGAVGTCGDYGVLSRIHAGTAAATDSSFRLYEEINHDGVLGGTGDNDFIAKPDGLEGRTHFSNMNTLDDDETHHLTLSLERVTPNASGQSIFLSVDLDGTSFGEQDTNGTGSPDFTSQDSFDYFVANVEGFGLGAYAIDNFMVELISAPVQTADFDENGAVDGVDFLAWQQGAGTTSGATLADGDANGDGAVNDADLVIWETQYGSTSPLVGAVSAVPEPSAVVLSLLGASLLGASRRRTQQDFS